MRSFFKNYNLVSAAREHWHKQVLPALTPQRRPAYPCDGLAAAA